MQVKRLLAAALSAALLGGALPLAGAAGSISGDARRADLDYLMAQLEQRHPDFYANVDKQEVADQKAQLAKIADTLSDFDFAVETASLVNMAGDAHTSVSYGALTQQAHLLPFSITRMDDRWVVTAVPQERADALGTTLTAIAGVPLAEVYDRLKPALRHENEQTQQRDFKQQVYVFDFLAHYEIVPRDAKTVELTVSDENGASSNITLPVLTSEAYKTADIASAAKQRTSTPPTEYDRESIYKSLDLGDGALYIQYNQCRPDEKLPMAEFAAQVKEKLDSGAYQKLVIDLRNNGGGSDGVLNPVMRLSEQFVIDGKEVYTLIGERTFSSAVINAVQLKQVGATLVGEPTGGSVDHFGAVNSFELPNSKLKVQHSTKFIKLSELLPVVADYGVESLRPDIACGQGWADYRAGVDSAVERILGDERTAVPSSARVLVQSAQIQPAGYIIAGSNYYKLRDLAAALAATELRFSVSWDERTKSIDLMKGQNYQPAGGELQPVTGGQQTAIRSQSALSVGGKPASIAGYAIAGNNYYKLRDLCALLDITVEWEQATNTVSLTKADPK